MSSKIKLLSVSHAPFLLEKLGFDSLTSSYFLDGNMLIFPDLSQLDVDNAYAALDIAFVEYQILLDACIAKRVDAYSKVHWDDLRFNDILDGTNTEVETRLAIKKRFPKPAFK